MNRFHLKSSRFLSPILAPATRAEQDAAMQSLLHRPPGRCVLCGQRAQVRGVFRPDDSQAWRAPRGKKRMIFYDLCTQCQATDERTLARIEARLRVKLRRSMAHSN